MNYKIIRPLVATFPPIWQLPLAPKSRGKVKLLRCNIVSSFSKTQPACTIAIP